MKDDLKKNGRQPQENERRPQKKEMEDNLQKKMEDNLKKRK
jgi:hypothetical protein